MARITFRNLAIAGALGVSTLAAMPATAQFKSDGYEFLEAVKDREGDIVTEMLSVPGTVLINSRYRTTGETALHIVTQRRDAVWIQFLAQKGANPNIADKNGITPLQIAANLGFVDGVEELLKAGARVDVTNNAGETPLISAVHRRDVALVRLLLDQNASPDQNDNSGRSARDYAELLGTRSAVLDEILQADEKRKSTKQPQTYGPSF